MPFFIDINDILQKPVGAIISVQGVVSVLGEVKKLTPRNASESRPLRKRNLQIVDQNGVSVWVSVWNSFADSFPAKVGDIIQCTNLKTGVYLDTTSLSTVPFTKISLMVASEATRQTYGVAAQRAVPLDGFAKLSQLPGLASHEKSFAWVRVNILSFTDSPFYQGCAVCHKSKDCDYCIKCNLDTMTTVEMALRVYVEDDIVLPLMVFTSCATGLFGRSAVYLHENPDYYSRKLDELIASSISVRVTFHHETYEERQVLKLISLTIVTH